MPSDSITAIVTELLPAMGWRHRPRPTSTHPASTHPTGRQERPIWRLAARIEGHDTHLTAQLELGRGRSLTVRLLTLDDLTLLYPTDPDQQLPESWNGRLLIRRPTRGRAMPDDLSSALTAAGVTVENLQPQQRRHLIGFVTEAPPGAVRRQRITSVVAALADLPQLEQQS